MTTTTIVKEIDILNNDNLICLNFIMIRVLQAEK